MKWIIGAMVAIAAMVSADPAGSDSRGVIEMTAEHPSDASAVANDGPADPVDGVNAPAASESVKHRVGNYASGVVGGPHDFSESTGGQTNACGACHIPHIQRVQALTPGADDASNRSAAQDDEVFLRLYRVEGQRATFEPDRYTPGPSSLICLGCHDGTLASSTMGSAHAMLAGVREGFNVPDGFVWRDHPIGVPYPRGDRDYRPFGQVVAGGAVRMPQERVECVSCHDPHNTAGVDKMLVMSNRRSALCLSCHIK